MTETERSMYAFWKQWFTQPLEAKMKHLRSPGNGGYYPAASESPGFTGNPDPKEYFHWRCDRPHPDCGAPAEDVSATTEVFNKCLYTARVWLADRGLAALCDLPAENHVLRIIHYPASPTGNVGEAHRDFDLLTVSVEGTEPGLEINIDSACPTPETCPCGWEPQETGIQVGEQLEIYTGGDVSRPSRSMGQLQATTHRVRTAPNTERFKAVFFYLPPSGFELSPGYTSSDYLKEALTKAGTYKIGSK